MDAQPVAASHGPFPVDPADVPPDAVRAVRRTLLRHPGRDADDEELARLVVAVVIAALTREDGATAVVRPVTRLCWERPRAGSIGASSG